MHKVTAMLLAIVTAAATGCGSGRPETAPVHGRITYGGRPVEAGTIYFWPAEGVQARGQIGADGTYRLGTYEPGDGAAPGEHTVTIEARRVRSDAPKIDSFEAEVTYYSNPENKAPGGTVEQLLPARYAHRESSKLTATVELGDNEINFDLPVNP